MNLYVVETICDNLVQMGCSLNKEQAEKRAEKLNKKSNSKDKYWVSVYHISEKKFTEFD